MRKEFKLLVVLIAMMSVIRSTAQSSASATASVTILSPVSLSADRSTVFEKIATPLIFGRNIYLPKEFVQLSSYNSTIKAADILINGNGADVYALTIPEKIFLMNEEGTEAMVANVLPAGASRRTQSRDGH